MTATAATRTCVAAVAVLALGLLVAGPAFAHSEGLTPYRYVVAPAGVESEGPAEAGVSSHAGALLTAALAQRRRRPPAA